MLGVVPVHQIEFPNPDRRQKRLIFQACTAKMNLSEEVDLEVRGASNQLGPVTGSALLVLVGCSDTVAVRISATIILVVCFCQLSGLR